MYCYSAYARNGSHNSLLADVFILHAADHLSGYTIIVTIP